MDLARIPVLIGAGQHTNRIEDPEAAPNPFELLEAAAGAAAADAREERLLARLTHVWVVNSFSLRHDNPAGELARRLGAAAAETRYSGLGGSMPQWLVNRAAERVLAGSRPLALIAGAEALATRRRARKAGLKLEWPRADGQPELWPMMESGFGVHPVEMAHGLQLPTHMYALIETAVANAQGLAPIVHRERMGELMDRLNEVAARNPHAWLPTRRAASELITQTEENRFICYPYTKYLNAVMDVDMAAAVILTDAQTARELGLGPSEVAYLAGWADAKDIWLVSERPSLAHSPAIAECGRTALAMARRHLDDVTAFDLYSCFPSSVEVALHALGLGSDDRRSLTLTGGLPYHGGPGNNYVTHVLANTLAHVREGMDEIVLVHGNGYFLTKHAIGVYTSRPPDFALESDSGVQLRIDGAATPVPVDPKAEGAAKVVAYTVPFERSGEAGAGIVLATFGDRRGVAAADAALTTRLLEGDGVGLPIRVTAGMGRNRATPA